MSSTTSALGLWLASSTHSNTPLFVCLARQFRLSFNYHGMNVCARLETTMSGLRLRVVGMRKDGSVDKALQYTVMVLVCNV